MNTLRFALPALADKLASRSANQLRVAAISPEDGPRFMHGRQKRCRKEMRKVSPGEIIPSRKTLDKEGIYVMKLEKPVRWGGLAALSAGVLLVVSELLRLYIDFADPGLYRSVFVFDGALGLLLSVLVHLGLVGLYARQAGVAGTIGLVGFVLAFIGVSLSMGASFVDAFVKPVVWPWEDPEYFERTIASLAIFAPGFVLGWVLFGVATLKTRIYPRAAAMLLIAGALILLLPLPLGGIVFAVAVAWMGYVLFTERGEEASQPPRA